MTTVQTCGAYHIGASILLTEAQLKRLVELFKQPSSKAHAALEGRSSVAIHHLNGIGSVAVKSYRRGGLIQHLNKRRYLKWGRTRSRAEFELLQKVRQLGIHAPEPIAAAHSGRLFYLAWLVTREIHQPVSLARLSLKDEKEAGAAMESAVKQISALIQNDILHVDLHPGNVVVDAEGKVYLLDFDKGYIHKGDNRKLIDRYIARWQRAVCKHRLPVMLSDKLVAGLQNI